MTTLAPLPAPAPIAAAPIADGCTDVPAGRIATVVTYLEMHARPDPLPEPAAHGVTLQRVPQPELGWYRALFRRIGEDWLWFSRLRLPDAALAAILHDPAVELYAARREGREIGLVELDFRTPGEVELAFFGLVAGETGAGTGRVLINAATARAFARAPSVERFFVHTCTLDHPAALAFYRKAGFVPVKQMVEIAPDPRLDGTLRREAAPHVPVYSEG